MLFSNSSGAMAERYETGLKICCIQNLLIELLTFSIRINNSIWNFVLHENSMNCKRMQMFLD